MTTTAPPALAATAASWWYGHGGAVDVTRRLESLVTLPQPPGPAGVVTVGSSLTVTFVEGLSTALPPPWQPAGREARIARGDVDPGLRPDPAHPVAVVGFGCASDGSMVALNLAAFGRIRIGGHGVTASALVSRWIFELLATHPATTVGVTADVWNGPWTSRVWPVSAGRVPDADVLVLGAALSYADRAQIVAAAHSPILLDLGSDAAVTTSWVLTCDADRHGALSNTARAASTALTVELIIPAAETVELCAELLTRPPLSTGLPAADDPVPVFSGWGDDDEDDEPDEAMFDAAGEDDLARVDPVVEGEHPESSAWPQDGGRVEDPVSRSHAALQPSPGAPPTSVDRGGVPTPADAFAEPSASSWAGADTAPAPGAQNTETPAAQMPSEPAVAVIWNRILGQVAMTPPHGGPQVPDREKRLNELLVYLQWRPWATSSDIITDIYGGAASDKTLQQQVSLLRGRLGVIRPGGPKALPPMRDGRYQPDPIVRSDWTEFERLVEILVETTDTGCLVAAMNLVTGRPLGGIGAKEWAWAVGLRDEIRSRVPQAAVVLAERHHAAGNHSAAVETARKGLWYDTARQDLWRIAMLAAHDGRDRDAFRALRGQYLSEIPPDDRDPDTYELTKRGG